MNLLTSMALAGTLGSAALTGSLRSDAVANRGVESVAVNYNRAGDLTQRHLALARRCIESGTRYLIRRQHADGSWQEQGDSVRLTSIALIALAQARNPRAQDMGQLSFSVGPAYGSDAADAIDRLTKLQGADGSWGGGETSISDTASALIILKDAMKDISTRR